MRWCSSGRKRPAESNPDGRGHGVTLTADIDAVAGCLSHPVTKRPSWGQHREVLGRCSHRVTMGQTGEHLRQPTINPGWLY